MLNNAYFYSNKVSELSGKLDSKEWLSQFLVCSIQPIKITDVLTENLKKVIMIGSRISSFNAAADKNNISNVEAYGYRTVKVALHSGSIVLAKSFNQRCYYVRYKCG